MSSSSSSVPSDGNNSSKNSRRNAVGNDGVKNVDKESNRKVGDDSHNKSGSQSQSSVLGKGVTKATESPRQDAKPMKSASSPATTTTSVPLNTDASASASTSGRAPTSSTSARGTSAPPQATVSESDTFDLTRIPEQHELIKLVRVVTRLYCHGISQEFRRPVHLMYPEIALHYIKSIREPMDLGSLLFLLLKTKAPLQHIRHKLRLIFANAVAFNSDAHQMIAISTHINQFAKALWQEVISLPYAGDNITRNAFKVDRYIHRFNRYRFVCEERMTTFEGKEIMNGFTSILKQISGKQSDVASTDQRFVHAFVGLAKRLRSLVDENFARLDNNSTSTAQSDSHIDGRKDNSDVHNVSNRRGSSHLKTMNEMKMELPSADLHYLKATLAELIEPFAKEVIEMITSGVSEGDKKGRTISLPIFLVYHYNSFYAKVEMSQFVHNWLQVIDDVIGELLPGGVERLTRGFPLSCVWARPHRIVWAQPPKDAWWPGMVLAGHGVPKALAAANFSRIPDEIAKQLLKIKPKVTETAPMPTKSSNDLVFNGRAVEDSVATDNCVLVEFFGSHDFGWIKLEQLTPFPMNGAFVPPSLPPEATATERAKRERCQQLSSPSVREALSSLQALVTCDAVAKGDDAPPPSMEELTEIDSIVQEAMKVFQVQAHLQAANQKAGNTKSPSYESAAQVGKGPPLRIPKSFGELIDITGPNAVSIHKLSPQDLGLTVASVKDVIKDGTFNSAAVQLHYGLSLQDRALWRTRIMATALDQFKPVFPPGQEMSRPKPFTPIEMKSKGGRISVLANTTNKNLRQQLEKELTDKLTTKFASNNSTIKRKMLHNGNKSLPDKDEDERRKSRKKSKDFDEILEMIPINTNALYTASSETGRKWMIGIFASGEMLEDAVTQIVGGDGALHSRKVNFNSQLFQMENKKISSRKELLKDEIDQMETLVKQMKEHIAKGDMTKFPSSSLAATLQNRDARNHSQSSNSQFVMEGVSGITAADVSTASLASKDRKRRPRSRSRPCAYDDPTRPPILNIDGSIRKKPGPKSKAEKAAMAAAAAAAAAAANANANASLNDAKKHAPHSNVVKNNTTALSKQTPATNVKVEMSRDGRDDGEDAMDVA